MLKTIQDQVRFARARFGWYDPIDFVAVLIGYILSGEPTILAFYERLAPFASSFMALFGRNRLPQRSTLSRFLAALDQSTVEALRTRFHEEILARTPFPSLGGLFDRTGKQWVVIDADGTRQAARQRALPQTDALPVPHRRFDQVCAPGYTGCKRGEVVRTRTTVLQMHTHHWVASFSNSGNGPYREELCRAKTTIQAYVKAQSIPPERTRLRLDGQYGTEAVISDVADFSYVTRGKDDKLLARVDIQARLHLPADQYLSSPESGVGRALYDYPDRRLGKSGPLVRIIVVTHPVPDTKKTKRQVGLRRLGAVSELFFTNLPQSAFTASAVVSLSLHRGAFETVLENGDIEHDPDRWCGHSAWRQETWQIIAQ